jgi:hypothetical protein
MDNNNPILNITLEEVLLFILINVIMILTGIILWYFIWIKQYGGSIPNPQFGNEEEVTYFHSKNFVRVVSELWTRITNFDKKYMLRSIGMESYVYLFFQRKLCSLLLRMTIFSFLLSLVTTLATKSNEDAPATWFQDFLLNNKFLNDFTTIVHIISLALFTFLHFRFFTLIKTEIKYLYFDRFDKMSRKKDADWLSCRTLHISGLGPNDRNSKILNYIFK